MLLYARSQHDHGNVFAPSQLLQHCEAVEDGQHDIENHEVVSAIECRVQAIPAIVGAVQMMASPGKELLHHAAQLNVVIDKQER